MLYTIFTPTKINFFIDIIAGTGTFISSIIALFTLREVIKQRRAIYQPKLYFNEFALSVKGNPYSEKKSFYNYYLHNLYEPIKKDSGKGNAISAQFFFENIGYGIANNINYEWSFDHVKAVKIICSLNPRFKYEYSKDNKSIMIIFDDKYFNSYQYDDIGSTQKIDFIKPESLQKNIKPTTIPVSITDIYMDYVIIKNKMFSQECKIFDFDKFDNFPVLKLNISYHDIANKKYKTEYSFEIHCSNSFEQIDDEQIDTERDYALLSFNLK